MNEEDIYELVTEAVRQALAEERGGEDITMERRMLGGRVIFEDEGGRLVREIHTVALFKKVTSVRDKLRVLEQKVNSNRKLDAADKAELQGHISRAYGSLTTFNFLFAEDKDRFKGTGG